MSIYDLNAYEVLQTEDLSDLKSKGTLLKHKKSGARVLLMENDDENKVFTIGFRTPPSDSTGVPHIMEHSVLCGSKEISGEGSVCGAGEGLFEYIFECDDLSGQDIVSGRKLQ